MELVSTNKCFGGKVCFYKHDSVSVKTPMTFSIFLPPVCETSTAPVLYFLSGLTCTAENFTHKAGAFRQAAELGLIIVCPDTSPRGAGVEGEDERYDLGSGAGFYVNATQGKWAKNYQMYDYVTQELPELIKHHFPTNGKSSVFGHSMGGHGALICALKNPQKYHSVSAFAPICAPSDCPWGQLAFTEYLGSDPQSWYQYDASQLIAASAWRKEILIDQGDQDQFLAQLNVHKFAALCQDSQVPVTLNMREGYDHSYYFISTFIDNHLRFHASALQN